jgi:hypothetical protein
MFQGVCFAGPSCDPRKSLQKKCVHELENEKLEQFRAAENILEVYDMIVVVDSFSKLSDGG